MGNNANDTYVLVQSNRHRQLISTNNLMLWLFINHYDVIAQGELVFECFLYIYQKPSTGMRM